MTLCTFCLHERKTSKVEQKIPMCHYLRDARRARVSRLLIPSSSVSKDLISSRFHKVTKAARRAFLLLRLALSVMLAGLIMPWISTEAVRHSVAMADISWSISEPRVDGFLFRRLQR